MSNAGLALEFAVQSVAGARVSRAVGADRVELCAALGPTGGIAPSPGIIEQTVAIGLPTLVMVRCRPGPFEYDADELAAMARDTEVAMRAGAAGVVFGALTPGATVDADAVARIRDTARGVDPAAQIVFHRAFDVLIGLGRAERGLEALVELGCTRILSSGGAARAADGAPVIAKAVRQAAGRIEIQAGGHVRPHDLETLAATGVDAVHTSAMGIVVLSGPGAGPGGGDDRVEVTDPSRVQAMADAVAAVRARG
ncbi:MAG: hypothetical protein FWF75_01210 [Propionibacteriaceae bacterium]|nr:hypothetical protein [Propionibacteriaceae bacterium]